MREKEPYIKLPIRYLHETDWAAAIIRAYIDGFINSDKTLFQTQDEIAKTLDCVRETISRKTKILCEKKMVVAKRTQRGIVYLPISDETESHNGKRLKVNFDETESHNGKRLKVTFDETENHNDNNDDIKTINNNLLNKNNIGGSTPEIISIPELVLIEWNEHYEKHFNTGFVPDYRSLTNDKDLIVDAVKMKMRDFQKNVNDVEETRGFIREMFEAMFSAADEWQKKHWTLHTVATQFNQLYNTIINGNNNSNSNSGISRDYLERKMREAAGIV